MAPEQRYPVSLAQRSVCRQPHFLLLSTFSLLLHSTQTHKAVAAFHSPCAFWSRKYPNKNSATGFSHHKPFSTFLKMAKLDSPSAQRNKEPIWNILSTKVLRSINKTGAMNDPISILEIAAGCGVHSHHFSLELVQAGIPFLWYPSDPDEISRASIQAYLDEEPSLHDKLQAPLDISLAEDGPVDKSVVQGVKFDLVMCINMIHISPWTATLGLMKLAEDHVSTGGILFLYGPYKVNGSAVESNL
jgi:Protein of unknown function (DUF938)